MREFANSTHYSKLAYLSAIELCDVTKHEEWNIKQQWARLGSFTSLTGGVFAELVKSGNVADEIYLWYCNVWGTLNTTYGPWYYFSDKVSAINSHWGPLLVDNLLTTFIFLSFLVMGFATSCFTKVLTIRCHLLVSEVVIRA